ncbi:hypothetical protein NQ314_008259 [Rhamnusium bicolor]|uniref:Uncharacterized protein n=1 Tax=Rhamnusium bicolor TaxID=1586634 RepID=A0AAV8YDQ9_9CUCU|nr:hypothetical protein NQ314_008259 [Rhamnusium bicolor]
MRPIITVTGAKNAKLICIKDENSIIEPEDDSEPDKDCQTEKVIPLKVTSSKTQTDIKRKEKVDRSTQKSTKSALIKMNKLPKSSKCLRLLPKNYAVNIIQYKLDFYKHCKTNPMYRRTTNLQPWMLMGK